MGQRERRRQAAAERTSTGYARGRERDEAARAALKPLAPGERPGAVTAAALGLANLVALVVGVKVNGHRPSPVGVLAFCAVMFAAAYGMWRVRYWAILGFQALLALIVIVFFLFLLRASNVAAVVIPVAIIGGAGWLFWKLVGAMARIQMPGRDVP